MSETSDFAKRVRAQRNAIEVQAMGVREALHARGNDEARRHQEREDRERPIKLAKDARDRAYVGTRPELVLGEGAPQLVHDFLDYMHIGGRRYWAAQALTEPLGWGRKGFLWHEQGYRTRRTGIAGYLIGETSRGPEIYFGSSGQKPWSRDLQLEQEGRSVSDIILCVDGLLRTAEVRDLPVDLSTGAPAPVDTCLLRYHVGSLGGSVGEYSEKEKTTIYPATPDYVEPIPASLQQVLENIAVHGDSFLHIII